MKAQSSGVEGRRESLGAQMADLHQQLRQELPQTERIGCALYDHSEDLLKTFVHSTCSGEALRGYECPLSSSPSLRELARSGAVRFLPDLRATLDARVPHSAWVLREGYQSSLTVPMYHQGEFTGFVFFDSRQPDAFGADDQRHLRLYAHVITLLVAHELQSVRAMVGSAGVARAFCNLRDFETGAHLERMARFSRLITKELAVARGLTDEFIELLFLFAPLHDIGKIGISDAILLKAGPLDDAEYRVMQTHVERGVQIIERMLDDLALRSLPGADLLHNLVAFHHEHLDGSGYPQGVRGDAIPIEARIVTVADIFDALTSRRPYKESWPMERALAELERMATRGKLDAECVAPLRQQAGPVQAICERHADA